MKCHCDGELIKHTGGLKDGCFHCDSCFCCMEPDGNARAGHPGCGRFGFAREKEWPTKIAVSGVIEGDGTGEQLPPFDATQLRTAGPVKVKMPKRRSVK